MTRCQTGKWTLSVLLIAAGLLSRQHTRAAPIIEFLGKWQDGDKHITLISIGSDGRTPTVSDEFAKAWPGTFAQDSTLRFTQPLEGALAQFSAAPPGVPPADMVNLGNLCRRDPKGTGCQTRYEFRLKQAIGQEVLERTTYRAGIFHRTDDNNNYIPDSLKFIDPAKDVITLTRVNASNDGGWMPPTDWSTVTNNVLPGGNQNERGTWLTVTGIRDRPQDLAGLWTTDGDAPIVKFEADGYTLAGLSLEGEIFARLSRTDSGTRWEGMGAPRTPKDGTGFIVCPLPKGTCTQLCKLAPGFLETLPDGLHLRGGWHDKGVDAANCTFDNTLASGSESFSRFIGISFSPIAPGKFIYIGAAPAVGPNAGQFKTVVRLSTNYVGVGAASVRTTAQPANVRLVKTSGDGIGGVYEFSAQSSGRYELAFELIGKDDLVFHTDRVRIDIPSLPGVGR